MGKIGSKIMNPKTPPKNIDEYIQTQPPNIQAILGQIRQTIHQTAPQAEETISYQIPAFKQNGILVWFAAYKNHISFFPKANAVEVFKYKLSGYKTSKGTIQFPLNQPMPLELITEIVRYRVKENTK
jgi:uncharacterized protein YdhG (YjbR/CyaY superfamily)